MTNQTDNKNPDCYTKLNWIPVESTQMKAIAYDSAISYVFVEFNSGAKWSYFPVPQEVFDLFAASGSKGNFFGKNIKGKYTEHRILEVDQACAATPAGNSGASGFVRDDAGNPHPMEGAATEAVTEDGDADNSAAANKAAA